MFQEEFNKLVGENLAKYRKFNNYTQIALAEKINYSDKAVSKWEKGECLPDVYVLKQLADLYGVTVNDLITPNKKPKASLQSPSMNLGVQQGNVVENQRICRKE